MLCLDIYGDDGTAASLDPLPLALVGIGSLIPDIDHPQSWVGLRLPVISRPLVAMAGHRGITHSLLAVIVCGLLLRWVDLAVRLSMPSWSATFPIRRLTCSPPVARG
jgi:membrane-bound metal-dependent hydrolase YbcI (DUF457 family)